MRQRPSGTSFRAIAVATLALLLLTVLGAAQANARVASQAPGSQHLCSAPARVGYASCFALRRTTASGKVAAFATPSGFGPAAIQSAYALPAGAGAGKTVAIVDAYDLPTAEADLGAYRSQFGLPPCTTANGCFRKVNQTGGTTPPAADSGWGGEIALDLDMVSAACPSCKILLVEANSASIADLGTAVNRAAVSGAVAISNSYGGPEDATETTSDTSYYNHPGIAVTASSGDDGFGTSYPANSPYVTAVGGTSLTTAANARGWTESAWNGAGSGCSTIEPKRSWQVASCTGRAMADVSAVADPNTGVAVYDTYQSPGWQVFGGTSASSPIIASVYAMAAPAAAGVTPAQYAYANPGALFDVTTGSNGSTCTPSLMCHAGAGYDGPTGLGTPNGTGAFGPVGGTGQDFSIAVTPASGTVLAGNSATTTVNTSTTQGAPQTVALSASGLPAGAAATFTPASVTSGGSSTLTISTASTTPAGTYSIGVLGTGTTAAHSAVYSLAVTTSPPTCAAGNKLANPGFESGATSWSQTSGVIGKYGGAQAPHAGVWDAWLDGYGSTHTDTLSQSVTIPAGCATYKLSFWLKITSAETTTVTAYDKLTVKLGTTTLATYSNLNKAKGYLLKSFNVAGLAGQRVTLLFTGTEDVSLQTSFVVDDTALSVT